MWQSSPDSCCAMNKREPFDRAKRELGMKAWLTGIRREQSATRKNTPIVQLDHKGLIKFCPIANWTARDVHYYLQENELPYHPLRGQRATLSIGCHPEEGYCTMKVKPGAGSSQRPLGRVRQDRMRAARARSRRRNLKANQKMKAEMSKQSPKRRRGFHG